MKFSADVWTETLEIDETGYVTKSKLVYIVLVGIHADNKQEAINKVELTVSNYCENILKSVYQILEIDCRRIH